MKISEVKKDLFTVEPHYRLAHCVSSDYVLGAGIAAEFDRIYGMRRRLAAIGDGTYPDCIQVEKIFNLVTKDKYWHKPTYGTLKVSLMLMKHAIVSQGITHLAMPRIGSGLDKLEWSKVKSMIVEVFEDTDIEILICYV